MSSADGPASPLFAPPLASQAHRLPGTDAIGLLRLLMLLSLPPFGQPGRPVEWLRPEAMALQRLAGLARVGKTGADPVLLGIGAGRINRPRRHGRPHEYPTNRHVERYPMTFQFQRGVLADEPGVGRRHPICLIVVDLGQFA